MEKCVSFGATFQEGDSQCCLVSFSCPFTCVLFIKSEDNNTEVCTFKEDECLY
jgi:hypothetical protein